MLPDPVKKREIKNNNDNKNNTMYYYITILNSNHHHHLHHHRVVYHEVLHTSQAYMRDLSVIDPAWLLELAPHYYQKSLGGEAYNYT